MRPEPACEAIRVEISARFDGEVDQTTSRLIDDHLARCASCRSHEHALGNVRRTVRAQPAESVPDLSTEILAAVGETATAPAREWAVRLRFAALGAAAAALLLLGTSVPWTDRPPATASASEIVRQVQTAAVQLQSYEARFEVSERGWHPQVPERSFRATIKFFAPENLSLRIRDRTSYPGREWPRNNIDLLANGQRWRMAEPATCPVQALPGCAPSRSRTRRSVINRQPFDGTTLLPTDIIVPLETIAGAHGLEVVGEEKIAERRAHRVAVPYRQAVPLVDALRAGGSWRDLHPSDRVEIWIDGDTWFPLRFRVVASGSAERRAWARAGGYDDVAGNTLLEVTALSFSTRAEPPPPVRRAGVVRDGGFERLPFERATRAIEPAYTAALQPYIAGRTEGNLRIATYATGITWLKVVAGPPAAHPATTAQEIRLRDGGTGYYEPADEHAKRRVVLYGERKTVTVESNLSRSELLDVAGSLPVEGRRLPRRIERAGGTVVRRLDPSSAFDLSGFDAPRFLPPGYQAISALESRSPGGDATLTVRYVHPEAEYDGFGIRVTQSRPARRLPPSSEQLERVTVGDVAGRWSSDRGVLEWIDGGVYRAVAAPSFGVRTALRIAEGMQ
jgi:hypothetical protein